MPPDIISFNSGDAPGGPIPKSDTYYFTPWIYKSLSFNIRALAVASGIVWMVFYIIIALIRGDTLHFDILANQVVKDLARIAGDSKKPVAFGIVTADTQEQALERAGCKAGNKGWQAALSALEMADLWREM